MHPGRRSRWLKRVMTVSVLASWVAWLLIPAVDVETVCISGPVLLLLGVTIIFLARVQNIWALALGVAQIGICLLFFGLVIALQWGPGRAEKPFAWMGLIYLLVMAFPMIMALSTGGKSGPTAWHCTQCGYFLFGITQPRCPECGTGVEQQVFEQIKYAFELVRKQQNAGKSATRS